MAFCLQKLKMEMPWQKIVTPVKTGTQKVFKSMKYRISGCAEMNPALEKDFFGRQPRVYPRAFGFGAGVWAGFPSFPESGAPGFFKRRWYRSTARLCSSRVLEK